MSGVYVDGAGIYVECDDGMLFLAENHDNGVYSINNGKLNPERSYRLNIELDGRKYQSAYSNPIITPDIDDVFWIQRGERQPVIINVSTHSVENHILYYKWSYREEWEYTADYIWVTPERCQEPSCHVLLPEDEDNCPQCGRKITKFYNHYCWGINNGYFFLSSAERTTFGRVTEKITEINPRDIKLSILYRITVRQNAVSKQAYDYFTNVRKNTRNTGDIFSPVPSELQGNITCITDPGIKVIGFVDVSTTSQKEMLISHRDNLYVPPDFEKLCRPLTRIQLCAALGNFMCDRWVVPNGYIVFDYVPVFAWIPDILEPRYSDETCFDCTLYGGTPNKPEDWPQ